MRRLNGALPNINGIMSENGIPRYGSISSVGVLGLALKNNGIRSIYRMIMKIMNGMVMRHFNVNLQGMTTGSHFQKMSLFGLLVIITLNQESNVGKENVS